MSHVTCNSQAIRHKLKFGEKVHLLPPVMCHLSLIMCHVSHVIFLLSLFDNVMKLVVGGSVIDRANSVNFKISKNLAFSICFLARFFKRFVFTLLISITIKVTNLLNHRKAGYGLTSIRFHVFILSDFLSIYIN